MKHINMAEKKKTGSSSISSSGAVTPLAPASTKINDSDRLKELRKPRSRKYMRDAIELNGMLIQLDNLRKIARLTDKKRGTGAASVKQEGNDTAKWSGNKDIIKPVDKDEDRNEYINTEGTVFQPIEKAAGDINNQQEVSSDEDAKIKTEIDEEIAALERRIEAKLETMARECSVISTLVTMIYPSDLESYLLSCGVIHSPGRPLQSRNDVILPVNDRDAAVIEHYKRGYDIYMQYWQTPDFLCVEVYRDAYCIIYRDGIVKTLY
jgi:hypothetical protein